MSPAHAAAALLVLVACIPDLRSRRIPNWLTFGAAVVAVLFHSVTQGFSGLGHSTGGWLLGLALFLPLFALRGMGAGDVKLLAAVGAWLGPADVLWAALITAIAGGVLAVIVAVAHGYLRTALRNIFALLMEWRFFGVKPIDGLTLGSSKGPKLAYAVPIAVGTLITLWIR